MPNTDQQINLANENAINKRLGLKPVKATIVEKPHLENIKVKTDKPTVKTVKICPKGKELNPKTGRCNKIKRTFIIKTTRLKNSKVKKTDKQLLEEFSKNSLTVQQKINLAKENAINKRLGLKPVKATIVNKPLMKAKIINSKQGSKPIKFKVMSRETNNVIEAAQILLNLKKKSTKLDITADLKDIYGEDIKTSVLHRAGKCVFPFKVKKVWPDESYTGKMLGEEYSGKKREILVNDCIKSARSKKYGYWCATSVDENNKPKTFGFCKPHPYQSKNAKNANAKNTKKANKSNANNSQPPNNTSKERLAVNYYYDKNKNKKIVKYAKIGTCKFPFKTRSHKEIPSYTCKKTKMGDWCATKLKPKNILKSEWGFCIPEGMTREEYDKLFLKKLKKV
jgi:hypothetical protein